MDIKRFDIIQADMSGAVDSEQDSIRPVLIVQSDIGNFLVQQLLLCHSQRRYLKIQISQRILL